MVSSQLGLVEYSVHLLEHWEGLVAVVHCPIVAATAAEEARCKAWEDASLEPAEVRQDDKRIGRAEQRDQPHCRPPQFRWTLVVGVEPEDAPRTIDDPEEGAHKGDHVAQDHQPLSPFRLGPHLPRVSWWLGDLVDAIRQLEGKHEAVYEQGNGCDQQPQLQRSLAHTLEERDVNVHDDCRQRKGEEGAGGWIDEEVEHPIASLLLYPLYIIFQGRAHLHLSLSQPILVDVKSRIIKSLGMS